jgi:hypothetical protein
MITYVASMLIYTYGEGSILQVYTGASLDEVNAKFVESQDEIVSNCGNIEEVAEVVVTVIDGVRLSTQKHTTNQVHVLNLEAE